MILTRDHHSLGLDWLYMLCTICHYLVTFKILRLTSFQSCTVVVLSNSLYAYCKRLLYSLNPVWRIKQLTCPGFDVLIRDDAIIAPSQLDFQTSHTLIPDLPILPILPICKVYPVDNFDVGISMSENFDVRRWNFVLDVEKTLTNWRQKFDVGFRWVPIINVVRY